MLRRMKKFALTSLLMITGALACQSNSGGAQTTTHASSAPAAGASSAPAMPADYAAQMGVVTQPEGSALATFAGGCFWCMEAPFDRIDGVLSTTSGYIDGEKEFPTYQEVSSGSTGHTEAIQVVFDPKRISYEKLVEVFWHNIDPTAKDRQFCDAGTQYRSGIYFHDDAQKTAAEASKRKIEEMPAFSGKVVTPVKAASRFWPAEIYHQDFYKKKPDHYQRYRRGCGRDARLKSLWGEAVAH